MSLVNDLLVELDRRNAETRRSPSQFLEGLSPRQDSKSRSKLWRTVRVLALSATVLFVGVGITTIVLSPTDDSSAVPPSVSASPRFAKALPEPLLGTSAPPIASAGVPSPKLAQLPEIRIERAPSLRSVTIQKRSTSTRLRFEIDGAVVHRMEQPDDNRSLELILESAGLVAALETLDLDGTPIRSLSTRADENGLRLAFALDAGLRINSQSLERADGTTLLVDLIADEPAGASSIPRGPRETLIERNDHAISPEVKPPNQYATRSADGPDEGARATTVTNGDLAISRSQGDQKRKARNTAHELASREIVAAQVARSEGDLVEADRRYAAAFGFSSDLPAATVQWATLLAEMSRTEEAIELIRKARRVHNRDPQLAMLHAQLLESSEHRDEAIALLDRAGFSLTEAPDIHALAAAYLQRAGRHAIAIDRYESIVRRYPEKSQWWMGLGISLEAEDRRAEAADVYRIAMQIGDLPRPTRRWVGARIEALGEGD